VASSGAATLQAGTVLVVEDDEMVRELIRAGLEDQGLSVVTARSGVEALTHLQGLVPDLVVSDVNMPDMDGFALISRLRSEPGTRSLPLIFLTSRADPEDAVTGLRLGADDYIRKPFELDEVVARVLSKLSRPPVPVDELVRDVRTGVLRPGRFTEELAREVTRADRSARPGAVAVVELHERAALRARFGRGVDDELALQVVPVLRRELQDLDVLGRDDEGRLLVLLPETPPAAVPARLAAVADRVVGQSLVVAGEPVSVTPVVGWTGFGPGETAPAERLIARAALAEDAASAHLDLQPVAWTPELEATAGASGRAAPPWKERLRTPSQIAVTYLVGWLVPFAVYLGLYRLGIDVSTPVYLAIVVALLVTGVSIWTEGLLALDPERPPRSPGAPEPRASAIIAAYLPNEAATVVETVESFLRTEYRDLQVILAYNTPRPMPVEATLRAIAERDPRFLPLAVQGSTSKAQNVNAALSRVTGEFVGVFDADHHPAPDAFSRAWRWLSNGYDVVQGHCVVRNGDATRVARTVAVEFEAIYAVSHPGRARLHGFGVFGGSNGYWRTERLRAIRMHGFMLTEDIDSSLRVVEGGGRIANDPALLSRELAPTTVGQLWNQRMRWAQGWFQVSLKHLSRGWASPHLSLRQKLGMSFLLGWREVYPWLSVQIVPVVAFLAVREGGLGRLDWLVSLFVLSTLFTMSVGPGQVLFAKRLAVPEIRRRHRWFWFYLVVASLAYTEWKNVIARVAQLKEVVGERQWKVTPRAAAPADAATAGAGEAS
jgi:DNA-binding response OmpR family regulator/cellulose synthase/poly-beta-1,6-N-acetylglucosamine synthase-like glycosyltransferase